MARKVRGMALLLIGVLLLLAAGGWLLYNERESRAARESSEKILKELEPAQENKDLLQAEGELFCAALSIKKLELELPVYQQWSEEHLAKAPCRWSGSLQQGGLIIAAHNYRGHFDTLYRMNKGDGVLLVDGAGKEYRFTVAEKTILDGTDVHKMKAGDWPLTLFTCTKGGKQRVTLRCVYEK